MRGDETADVIAPVPARAHHRRRQGEHSGLGGLAKRFAIACFKPSGEARDDVVVHRISRRALQTASQRARLWPSTVMIVEDRVRLGFTVQAKRRAPG